MAVKKQSGVDPTPEPAGVVQSTRIITDSDLKALSTFTDAYRLLGTLGVDVHDANVEVGTGFKLTKNKDMLLGIPFIMVEWDFYDGDFVNPDSDANEFVAITLVTEDGGKYIITDGSTGLCQELRDYTDRHEGRRQGLLCKDGLRVSRYDHNVPGSKEGPDATYYIA